MTNKKVYLYIFLPLCLVGLIFNSQVKEAKDDFRGVMVEHQLIQE